MATIKQINANRKNALLSKGPKTDLGKLNSSKNSLKHGLTAKQLVIGEDLNEFEKIVKSQEKVYFFKSLVINDLQRPGAGSA